MKESYGFATPRESFARASADPDDQCGACGAGRPGVRPNCLQDPPASEWVLSPWRRAIDVAVSVIVLLLAAVPMVLIACVVRGTSRGGALFSQLRVGRNGRLFRIYKFRTMEDRPAARRGIGLTRGGDARVTACGRILRKLKLDELPQFYNVLRGDMSLVGPRPKLPKYEGICNMPYRPGITGAATVVFRREEEMLRSVPAEQLDAFYEKRIKTLKARLDVCAMCRATPASDLRILAVTAGIRRQPAVPIVLDVPAD